MTQTVHFEMDGTSVSLESGQVAGHAGGAVWVSCEGTVILATATADVATRTSEDLALTVQYQEKLYATGRIPNGFTKRQGKRSDREILVSRSTDRCLRPFFPATMNRAVEVVIEAMSINPSIPPETLALLAASTALTLSDIPFGGPLTAVHLHRDQEGTWYSRLAQRKTQGSLHVGVSEAGISMLEGEFSFAPESALLEAAALAQTLAKPALDAQHALQQAIGKPKFSLPESLPTQSSACEALTPIYEEELLSDPSFIAQRTRRADLYKAFLEADPSGTKAQFEAWERGLLYERLKTQNKRLDNRGAESLRAPVGVLDRLPHTHGSALFSRGDTQVMAVTTLGSPEEELLTETLMGMRRKHFYVHYNFPSYAAGRQGRFGHWGRREIGHGHLIARALQPAIPSRKEFPHTISLIAEVLSANGSSSMASVCGGSLAMLSAGVPLTQSIAGVAVGMLAQEDTNENDEYQLILDPLCQEDALGEMDCKVCGGREGITAIQMDLKRSSLTLAQLEEALTMAKEGRIALLDAMDACIDKPRPLSPQAPRQGVIPISVALAKALLGAGGKKLRKLKEKSGAKIIINTSGSAQVSAPNQAGYACVEALLTESEAALPKATQPTAAQPTKASTPAPKTPAPKKLHAEDYDPPLKIGALYTGTVTSCKQYGAFVEIQAGAVGLLHVSELTNDALVEPVSHYAAPQQTLTVKLLHVDGKGRIGLSLRQVDDATDADNAASKD